MVPYYIGNLKMGPNSENYPHRDRDALVTTRGKSCNAFITGFVAVSVARGSYERPIQPTVQI